jgi:transcription elongation factor GreA
LDGDEDGKVSLGVIVSLLYEGDSDPEKMLVGSIEEQREDVEVLSPDSPLGEALMGASVGDYVTFEAPNGDLTVKLVAIEK